MMMIVMLIMLYCVCSSKVWVIRSRREDLLSKDSDYLHKNCLLCAAHFQPSQFMNSSVRNKLTWNAVPSLFNIPNPSPSLESKRRTLVRVQVPSTETSTSNCLSTNIQPTEQEFMNNCEGILSFTMPDHLHKQSVKTILVNFVRNGVDMTSSGLCPYGTEFILDLFVRCRIYFHLKYLSQKATDVAKRKNRKASKVMNT